MFWNVLSSWEQIEPIWYKLGYVTLFIWELNAFFWKLLGCKSVDQSTFCIKWSTHLQPYQMTKRSIQYLSLHFFLGSWKYDFYQVFLLLICALNFGSSCHHECYISFWKSNFRMTQIKMTANQNKIILWNIHVMLFYYNHIVCPSLHWS